MLGRYIVVLALVLLLSGCAGTSPPTTFYALNAGPAEPVSQPRPDLAIGLGPVTLPDTLERPQIVTRRGEFGMELSEFHRWAGDLRANLGRLMAARLMQRLSTDRVSLHPWPRHRPLDAQVRVDVLRFDGRLAGAAVLEGSWTLLSGDGDRELHLQSFNLSEPVVGDDYRSMVEALSRLSARLTDGIADYLAGFEQKSD